MGELSTFVRFLRSAAARTAQLLNMTDMARDVGVAPNTARHWLSILAASGLVWLLEPWHANLSKRLVKTPKSYFLDTGLAAYLTEWSSPATLEAGAKYGMHVVNLRLAMVYGRGGRGNLERMACGIRAGGCRHPCCVSADNWATGWASSPAAPCP